MFHFEADLKEKEQDWGEIYDYFALVVVYSYSYNCIFKRNA